MDDVPYEFIERVFAKLSFPAIHRMAVPAPLWQEVARLHNAKLQLYTCVMQPSERGLIYGFVRYGTTKVEKSLTLDEFVKLDCRYHRVVSLSTWYTQDVQRLNNRRNLQPVGDRLAEIVDFVAQFNLELVYIMCQQWKDQERRVLDECCEQNMKTEALMIHSSPGYEAFLLKQLRSDRLVYLNMLGCWDEQLRPHLEAFVCRPNLQKLVSPHFQCFDHKGIERIMAYWRSMDIPWKMARIEFGAPIEIRNQICEKLTWMKRGPIPKIQHYFELHGNLRAVVENYVQTLVINFYNVQITK